MNRIVDVYFNTSHVTVYHDKGICLLYAGLISIHLMLLFIRTGILRTTIKGIFQYISCYCLSVVSSNVILALTDFNTSHVTVYLTS